MRQDHSQPHSVLDETPGDSRICSGSRGGVLLDNEGDDTGGRKGHPGASTDPQDAQAYDPGPG